MPQQLTTAVENNFTKGLITESTGLNFPENAATDCDNCEFTLIGDVVRRQGIDFEENFSETITFGTDQAKSSYKWNNVSGDSSLQIVVEQVGSFLYFFRSSSATIASPLSNQILSSPVNISTFSINGVYDNTTECQFSDGNGYLFVYHPNCNPFYCSYDAGVVTGIPIGIQIRDFSGVEDGLSLNTRPSTLSAEHTYNLINQGWTSGSAWTTGTNTVVNPGASVGHPVTLTLYNAGLPIVGGDLILMTWTNPIHFGYSTTTMVLQATSYIGVTLVANLISYSVTGGTDGITGNGAVLTPYATGFVNTWFAAIGNYPSNTDVWWYFKNAAGAFSPATTIANVTVSVGTAPKGHFLLNAFDQNFTAVSGVTGLTSITTPVRPKTGTWFQGRVWYAGVDASVPAAGDARNYSWAENIYFSQVVTIPSDFGKCYQNNDPTSETLFDLLPTDGGVITIQGSGSIYKLYPIQNGMLVFAANGIWFITGSQGIGFSANDYTITKISSVQSISGSSFVDVQGLPYFWNEEGIYMVSPSKSGALEVNPITVGTILSFYNRIPLSSKKYVKGAYHPIDYNIQWVYRDTEAVDVDERYSFNRILNFNTYNKAFFPYTVDNSNTAINGIIYVAGPGGTNSPDPVFKYLVSTPSGGNFLISFAEENDPNYVDWGGINYESFFVTGYKLRGQGIKKFQPQYIQIYTRTNNEPNSYKVQGIWDYANNRNSGRWSSIQQVNHGVTYYDTVHKRIKIRGNGYALQFKIISTDGLPFDIQGWIVVDTVNQGT